MRNPEINKDQWYVTLWYRLKSETEKCYVYNEVYDGAEQYVSYESTTIRVPLYINKDKFLGRTPPEFLTVNLEGKLHD